jgi:phosphoribosyl 1,2-cyclic phosphodiesterase
MAVDCYLSLPTAGALGVASHHRSIIIEPMKRFTVGSYAVLPFDTAHDVDNMGFLIASKTGDKCIFLTDTPYCKYRFPGLTNVVVEANYSIDLLKANTDLPTEVKKRVVRNHFSLENVKGFLKANDLRKVENIHLVHLSNGNSDMARFKREIQRLTGIPVYTY